MTDQAKIAAPIADVGDLVTYTDRHGRQQRGLILSVRAHWRRHPGAIPLIIYDAEHPTARNRHQEFTANKITSIGSAS